VILHLAARNLTRHRWRSVLSLLAIVLGVASLLIGQGFLGGMTENLLRSQIDMVSGHVVARPAGYPTTQANHPVDTLLSVSDEDRAWLTARAEAWTGRLLFSPTAIVRGESLRVRAIGVGPEDAAVFPRKDWKVDGSLDGVVVSRGVARLLDVRVGDEVILQGRTHPGAMNAVSFPVAGVVSTGNAWFDGFGVFVPLAEADALLAADGKVSHVAIRLDSRGGADATRDALADRWAGVADVRSWGDETTDMMRLQAIRQKALGFLVGAILLMAASGIANTILMAAWERVREIGTLAALGMTRVQVLHLFLLEGVVLGAVGSALGAMLGLGVVGWYGTHGIDLTDAMEKGGANLPVSATLYLAVSPFWAVAAPLVGVAIAVLSSIYPARVASSLPPAEAVRS
jgi:ABC-type lipoprotein release transport system permease subunit